MAIVCEASNRTGLFMRKYSYMHKKSQADCAAECAERSWISASGSSLHSGQFCEMAVKTGVFGLISPPLCYVVCAKNAKWRPCGCFLAVKMDFFKRLSPPHGFGDSAERPFLLLIT